MSLLSGIRFISKEKREINVIESIGNDHKSNNNKYNSSYSTVVHDNVGDPGFKKRKSHKKEKDSNKSKKDKSKKSKKIKYSSDRGGDVTSNKKDNHLKHHRKRAYDNSSSSSDSDDKEGHHDCNNGIDQNGRNRNRNDDRSDDDSIVDMHAIAKEEEEKERIEISKHKDRGINRDRDRDGNQYGSYSDTRYGSMVNHHDRSDNPNSRSSHDEKHWQDGYRDRQSDVLDDSHLDRGNDSSNKKQFDVDRFKSLINSLKNKNQKDDDSIADGNGYNNDHDNDRTKYGMDDKYERISNRGNADIDDNKYRRNDDRSEKNIVDKAIDNDKLYDRNIATETQYSKDNLNNNIINNSRVITEVIAASAPIDITASNTTHVTTTATTISTTNQSAAALLRERLKMNKPTPVTPRESTITSTISKDTSGTIIMDNKEMVTLQNKLRKLNEVNHGVVSNSSSYKGVVASNGVSSNTNYKKGGNNNNDDMDDMDEIYRENILRLGDRYKGTEMGNGGAYGSGMRTGFDEENDIDMTMFERKKEMNTKDVLQRQVS